MHASTKLQRIPFIHHLCLGATYLQIWWIRSLDLTNSRPVGFVTSLWNTPTFEILFVPKVHWCVGSVCYFFLRVNRWSFLRSDRRFRAQSHRRQECSDFWLMIHGAELQMKKLEKEAPWTGPQLFGVGKWLKLGGYKLKPGRFWKRFKTWKSWFSGFKNPGLMFVFLCIFGFHNFLPLHWGLSISLRLSRRTEIPTQFLDFTWFFWVFLLFLFQVSISDAVLGENLVWGICLDVNRSIVKVVLPNMSCVHQIL